MGTCLHAGARGMFYTFIQNNSGGWFTRDKQVAEYVIIEAASAGEANTIAESIGIYFNGCTEGHDCNCCGDRWRPVMSYDGTESPEIHGEKAIASEKVIIYYA